MVLVTRRLVDTAHRMGVQVHVWTIDDRAEMARLLDLGVDGIMTDRPQVLKDLLVERGELDLTWRSLSPRSTSWRAPDGCSPTGSG